MASNSKFVDWSCCPVLRLFRSTRWALLDGCSWMAAFVTATWLRDEFSFRQGHLVGVFVVVAVAVCVFWTTGGATRLYAGRFAIGGIDEATLVTGLVIVVTFVVSSVDFVTGTPLIPRSVPLTAPLFALVISLFARLAGRSGQMKRSRPASRTGRRAIVYGAGERGTDILRLMLSGYLDDMRPVALLDDNRALHRCRFYGVTVRGGGGDLMVVAKETGAQVVVVAFGKPAPYAMRVLAADAAEAGIEVMVLRPAAERSSSADRSNLRELNVTDLIGGQRIGTDENEVTKLVIGARVLVIGAGGSIGSELGRQIHRLGPAELIMLDRDDSALHAVQLSIHGHGRLDSDETVLCDIRDASTLHKVFVERRPDIVFHAAGLKHVTALERFPDEAWKTNVLGAMNVLEAAVLAGVSTFVNISGAEAANPTSVLGRSQRIGERLVAGAAERSRGTFLSVRLGDVLDSRGSMLTTFTGQLAGGQPITVAHPEAARVFLTVAEAAHLTMLAAALGSSGEVLVLDTGTPTRIAELADMVRTVTGRDAETVYVGLGAGEKVYEAMLGPEETDHRPRHPAISHVPVPPLQPDAVRFESGALGVVTAMTVLASGLAWAGDITPLSPEMRFRSGS